jgi:hypothetical protein
MYCRNCGKSVQENLNYCSNCGARVEKSASDNDSSWLNNPATSVGYLGVFGLGGFIFLIISLLKQGLNPSAAVAISVLYLAALFGICYLILRQSSDSSGKPRREKTNAESEYGPPKNFRSEITKQLDEPQTEPIPSVTEHTTRTLDEVLVERK